MMRIVPAHSYRYQSQKDRRYVNCSYLSGSTTYFENQSEEQQESISNEESDDQSHTDLVTPISSETRNTEEKGIN